MAAGVAILGILILSLLSRAGEASAQTPVAHPDVRLSLEAGVYTLGCNTPLDTDLAQACFVRVDLPGDPVELGCVTATMPDTPYHTSVTVARTENQDADIRCYVTDLDGNHSDYSDNKAIVDFTNPGKGVIVSAMTPVASRDRLPSQFKSLTLSVSGSTEPLLVSHSVHRKGLEPRQRKGETW
jgi:hypothetical protein